MRRTEFKFQIWSVSLGVTVCIALPAGPNSLHSDLASFFSSSLPLSLSFFPCHISVHLQRSPHLSAYLSSFLLSILSSLSLSLSLCSLSKEGTSEPRFFILFKSEMAGSGIDMRQRGRKKLESLGWLAFHGAMFQDLPLEGLPGGGLWSIL